MCQGETAGHLTWAIKLKPLGPSNQRLTYAVLWADMARVEQLPMEAHCGVYRAFGCTDVPGAVPRRHCGAGKKCPIGWFRCLVGCRDIRVN